MLVRIARVSIALHGVESVLDELDSLYAEFGARLAAHAANPDNVHLCFAGCSHCCKRGAFFAVTLVEAVRLAVAITAMPEAQRAEVHAAARMLLAAQHREFAGEPRDVPGRRDPALFDTRVARVARTGVACPLLENDRCSIYEGRPFLCRAYGFPTDAYAVEDAATITFRSLCHLYAGHAVRDWVRARDLRNALAELSARLNGGVDPGRFTSAEAILAQLDPAV